MKTVSAILLIAVVALGAYLIIKHPIGQPAPTVSGVTATFYCADNKSIQGTFGKDVAQITLSDGRQFTLPLVPSGSGARYEATTTTGVDVVFWNAGDNAFLTENTDVTYDKCVAAVITPATSSSYSYTDMNKTFTFDFPNDFISGGVEMGYTPSWSYNATTSGLELASAALANSAQPNTNFAGARFTVGTSADPGAVALCTEPLQAEKLVATTTINGTEFTEFTSTDAAAGNLYETTSYRTLHNNQCWAVEYTIHSSNIGNYPPSAGIKPFDKASVVNVFNAVAQSFSFLQ